MEKWYSKLYRRNLVDMHIEDWNEEFLSKFNPKDYYDNLVKAHIESPMIYLQSHTGICNFKTKLAKTHNAFKKENKLKELINLCHDGGMKVVGYYSLIFNTWAEINHKDWTIRYPDGKTWRETGLRYGLCCPNNIEYREFVAGQIKEMADEFPNIDAIFYDMPYWEVACKCKSCQERFKKEYNEEIPDSVDFKDSVSRDYMYARQDWMADFCKFVKEKTNEYMPNCTVEFNFAAVVNCNWLAGSTEKINDESEFTGGDLYGDLYYHSYACKYYYGVTKNQPFEYMTCRCDKRLTEHTISKSYAGLKKEIMLTTAHHGASLIIDAIDPKGTLDSRVYDLIGKVFEDEMPYEKYMDKGELFSKVGVYFNSDIQFMEEGEKQFNNRSCSLNTLKTFIEKHIPCSIVANGNTKDLSNLKWIIASDLKSSRNSLKEQFISYVKNGGNLFLSGESDMELIKEFFGAEIVDYTNSDIKQVFNGGVKCYISPTKGNESLFDGFNTDYPLPVGYNLPIVKFKKGKVIANIVLPYTNPMDYINYASIHSNPPAYLKDYPAIIEVEYGKGKVVWSLASIENDDRYHVKNVFYNILNKENLDLPFDITASKFVESVIFKDKNDYYISLTDISYDENVEREYSIKGNGTFTYKVMEENTSDCEKGKFKDYRLIKATKID